MNAINKFRVKLCYLLTRSLNISEICDNPVTIKIAELS